MATEHGHLSNLIGYTFRKGWKVISVHQSGGNPTGGVYSMCFDVEKDGQVCFMKALDLQQYIKKSGQNGQNCDPVHCINQMTKQYMYERDLSRACLRHRVKNVACVIDDDSEYVDVIGGAIVPYLVFDMADCDLREKLDIVDRIDFAWKMTSLHEVAVGLFSLHKAGITHQDIKPSNILIYNKSSCDITKIGDLGCSDCSFLDSPYKDKLFTGDHTYSPPERAYRILNDIDDFIQKYLTDCYLLGSLIVFYLTGFSMNSLIYKNMPKSCLPTVFSGTLDELKSNLQHAFTQALIEIENSIPQLTFKERLLNVIKNTCNPDPKIRLESNKLMRGSSYNLERVISVLDLLRRKAELEISK